MMLPATAGDSLRDLDDATRSLVRLAAAITAGSETAMADALAGAAGLIPAPWVEELVLQTYLFAGFPRALNAMRAWRRVHPERATAAGAPDPDAWRADGERTCEIVYGAMYERLRENVRRLHPSLDDWMITEGYGKVLSRPGLDLPRRELCIVAACAASLQDRQLHSHLHGAVNAGVAPAVVDTAIDALADLLGAERTRTVRMLWARVRGK